MPTFIFDPKLTILLWSIRKTIYLDTDIIVVKSIDELFDLLDNFDILATLDTARKREHFQKHLNMKIPYLLERSILDLSVLIIMQKKISILAQNFLQIYE